MVLPHWLRVQLRKINRPYWLGVQIPDWAGGKRYRAFNHDIIYCKGQKVVSVRRGSSFIYREDNNNANQ